MPPTTLRLSWTIALLGVAGFVGIGWACLRPGRLSDFDNTTALAMKEYCQDHAVIRGIMIGFTHVGGVIAIIALTLAATLWHVWRKEFALAGVWVVMVAGGALLNQGIKTWLDRPRPEVELRDPAVVETNQSFPSGHSMGSLIGYGMLAYVLCLTPPLRRIRAPLVVMLAMAVALIGFSRIFLRAHWFSDVVAGFSLGAAWLALGIGWHVWRRSRLRTPPVSPQRSPS